MVNLCQICGAYAEYINYNVLCCGSCKVFFRRHGNREEKYFQCKFNNQCEINVNDRSRCLACRLNKCFQLGMNTDRFRPSRNKKLSLIKKLYENQQLPTLNLLQSDQSLLTNNQWILLNNLLTCYQESKFLFYGQKLFQFHEEYLPRETIYRKYVDEFLQLVYKNAGLFTASNGDLRRMPSNERSICVYNAVENVSCFTGIFALHHCQLYKLKMFRQIMENKYGQRTVDIHLWSGKYFNSNILLTKLAASLYAFSENFSNDFLYSIYIFQMQNKYAEIAWKYLIYKYGYFQAIQQFLNIVICLCSVNILKFHARNLLLHLNDVNTLVEQMELTFILDDVEEIISND